MPRHTKLLLAATSAAITLSFAASLAHARRLWFSASRFQAIWTPITFEAEGLPAVRCPVTMEGSFHSASISKVSGLLVGYVTSAKVNGTRAGCNNTGSARVNTETLPWHVRYLSFVGTLPTITGISLATVGEDFNVDPEGATPNCRVRTTSANPVKGIAAVVPQEGSNRRISRLRADEVAGIPVGGEFFCEISGATGHFSGEAEVFVQSSTTTRILVRLVQ